MPSGTARLLPAPGCARGNNSTAARAHMRASNSPSSPPIDEEAEVDHLDGESSPPPPPPPPPLLPASPGRRQALAAAAATAALAAASSASFFLAPPALAASFQPPGFKKDLKKGANRRRPLPLEAFSEGPEGLKYYDFKVGTGPEARLGDRVVVHYEARWKGEGERERERDRQRGLLGCGGGKQKTNHSPLLLSSHARKQKTTTTNFLQASPL